MSSESFFMTLATVADHRRDLSRLGTRRSAGFQTPAKPASRRMRALKRSR